MGDHIMSCRGLGIAGWTIVCCWLGAGCAAPPAEQDEPSAQAGPAAASAPRVPCTYVARSSSESEYAEFEAHADCATLTGGQLRMAPEHLSAVELGEGELAEVWVEDGWYYVRADGATLSVLTLDNGPDPFSEGLTRTRQGGKIAYADETLQVIVPPDYDFGWPFEDGVALVCRGCRPEPDGEHTALVGGQWGYIDRNGQEVVPVQATRDQAAAQLERVRSVR